VSTSIQQIRHSLTTAGLWERCGGVRATGMRVLSLHSDRDGTVDAFVEAARILIAEGADAIVLGCAGLAGLQQRVQARLDVPVVDGVNRCGDALRIVGPARTAHQQGRALRNPRSEQAATGLACLHANTGDPMIING
jgi:allantoin racemase